MRTKQLVVLPLVVAAVAGLLVGGGTRVSAQADPQARVSGTFNDYVWVEGGTGGGAWHVTGSWTAQLKGSSGKADFTASLLGVRSDLWAIQTSADPANPANRSPHSHHVGLFNADISVIPNGVRLTGPATITTNGNEAPFSNSPVQVDITGGGLLAYSNVKLTFLGVGAIGHFGPQPYDGLVTYER